MKMSSRPYRVMARVGEDERVGATVVGLDLPPRLDLVLHGVRAVPFEPDGVRRAVGTDIVGVGARRCNKEACERGQSW